MKPLLVRSFWCAGLLLALTPRVQAENADPIQRLDRAHLQATHETRLKFVRERVAVTNFSIYEDYRAVIHVHAEDSDHTGGTRAEVLVAAKKTAVRVVMFSDHRGPKADTWHGVREGVLLIAG